MNFNKIYENTFFSNVDIYTACNIHEHSDSLPTLKNKNKDENMINKIKLYEKFVKLYSLYYKPTEFIIPVNEELLTYSNDDISLQGYKLHSDTVTNKRVIICPKYPTHNLTTIKDFIIKETINKKFCEDLIKIMILGGYINSYDAEKIMIQTYYDIFGIIIYPLHKTSFIYGHVNIGVNFGKGTNSNIFVYKNVNPK